MLQAEASNRRDRETGDTRHPAMLPDEHVPDG
jgi:hypothetical protein